MHDVIIADFFMGSVTKLWCNTQWTKIANSIWYVQSNLEIRNGLIRNKLVLRNHFLWPICHLLHKDKELLALRNNFRATKKFLIAKFDCIMYVPNDLAELHSLISFDCTAINSIWHLYFQDLLGVRCPRFIELHCKKWISWTLRGTV